VKRYRAASSALLVALAELEGPILQGCCFMIARHSAQLTPRKTYVLCSRPPSPPVHNPSYPPSTRTELLLRPPRAQPTPFSLFKVWSRTHPRRRLSSLIEFPTISLIAHPLPPRPHQRPHQRGVADRSGPTTTVRPSRHPVTHPSCHPAAPGSPPPPSAAAAAAAAVVVLRPDETQAGSRAPCDRQNAPGGNGRGGR